MAVIINEMEVVVEPPAPQQSAAAAPGGAAPQAPIRPMDLIDVLARRIRHEWRLMAH